MSLKYKLVLICTLASTVHGYEFMVGGRDGWVLNPYESYNHWAQRLRFQINDTLLFKYKKGTDSVAVVNKDGYEKCNIENPIMKLEDGHSIFRFDKSGLFYFISGTKSHCINGQKLLIVVLALRNPRSPPSPPSDAPAPAPAPSSPPSEPPSPPSADGPSDTPAVVDDAAPHPPPHRSFATASSISPVLLSTILMGYVIVVVF